MPDFKVGRTARKRHESVHHERRKAWRASSRATVMVEGPFPEHYEPFETPLGYNPLHPNNKAVVSNPARTRVPRRPGRVRHAREVPAYGDHVSSDGAFPLLDQACAPECDRAAAAVRGDRRGSGEGGGRGGRAIASRCRPIAGTSSPWRVVTKRIKPLMIEGKKVQTVGIAVALGLQGTREAGLSRQYADALRGRREFADTGIQVVPRQGRKGIREKRWHCNHWISNASRPRPCLPPQVREPVTGTVAKLIDVSKCIGCKACQTACMEWNDLRDEIGTTTSASTTIRAI